MEILQLQNGEHSAILLPLIYGNNAYREEDNTRVYNRSLKIYWTHLYIGICPDALFTNGCFTGIQS